MRFVPLRVYLLLIVGGLLFGCASSERAPVAIFDSPLHHYTTGMRLLDAEQLSGAMRAFEHALALNEGYGPALAGKGLVLAKQGNVNTALELLEKGLAKASQKSSSPERLWVYTAQIRAYIALHEQNNISTAILVNETENIFARSRVFAQDTAMLSFWQGEAYIHALAFEKARGMFRQVQQEGSVFAQRASERLLLLERILRASLKTSVGKQIALASAISRADMAALLVEELGVQKFFSQTATVEKSYFSSPQASTAGGIHQIVLDIQDHPLQADIAVILQYALRGLEVYPDGMFQPNKPLSRAELAMIAEDIFIRIKNDESLATAFVGSTSPFPDVRADHPYFNAVIFATTRGLLAADLASGKFVSSGTVSGVEAVLLVDALISQLDLL